jgi:hypothetical protein
MIFAETAPHFVYMTSSSYYSAKICKRILYSRPSVAISHGLLYNTKWIYISTTLEINGCGGKYDQHQKA